MDEVEDYRFESVSEDVYLVVAGERIATTKFLVPSTSRAKWIMLPGAEATWTVTGTLGQPVIVRTAA